MSQTSSGPPASAPPSGSRAEVTQLDETLDKFERSLGIPAAQQDEVTEEARRLLTIPPSVLRKLDRRSCLEAAYVLEEFGFRIQQALNRESARRAWAQAKIERSIVHKLDSVGGYKYEERLLRAIASDEAAQALEGIRMSAALKLEKLAFLSNRIASMSKILAQLGDK